MNITHGVFNKEAINKFIARNWGHYSVTVMIEEPKAHMNPSCGDYFPSLISHHSPFLTSYGIFYLEVL